MSVTIQALECYQFNCCYKKLQFGSAYDWKWIQNSSHEPWKVWPILSAFFSEMYLKGWENIWGGWGRTHHRCLSNLTNLTFHFFLALCCGTELESVCQIRIWIHIKMHIPPACFPLRDSIGISKCRKLIPEIAKRPGPCFLASHFML